MRAFAIVLAASILAPALVAAHHGDTLLDYVDASGSFAVGLAAAGVEPVNYARFPLDAHVCHADLQILLDYAPTNASASAPGLFVAVPFVFQVEIMDDETDERLPDAVMTFRNTNASARYRLTADDTDRPLRVDLYMLVGAATEWSLRVRGWPDPFLPCTDPVVVNEVEANPMGGDAGNEWVELFNPNLVPVDLSGWTVRATHGTPAHVELPEGTVLASGERLLVAFAAGQALDNVDEVVVLEDASGAEVDRTMPLSDEADDGRTNQRVPDGSWGAWAFDEGTPDAPNT